MMEMKIKIEVPDLAAAIEKLAACVTTAPVVPGIAAPAAAPAPALTPPAPQAAPAPGPAPAAPVPPPMPTTAAPATPPVMPQTPGPAAPPMPVTEAPTYTLDQISKAGAALVDAGKMEPLLALLGKYGLQAITQLQPAQYGVFATELRALGAQI